MYVPHLLCSFVPVSGRLGWFHVLAIIQWTLRCVYHFKVWFSPDRCPGVGLLDHMIALFLFFFKEPPYCSLLWLYQFTFPPTMEEASFFSTLPPAFVICKLFDDGHSDWCETISHCSFDLRLSNNEWHWASFHMPSGHLFVFFGEMSIFLHVISHGKPSYSVLLIIRHHCL